MAKFYRCDECEEEMESWIEVISKIKEKGGYRMSLSSGDLLQFCSWKCLASWVDRGIRSVSTGHTTDVLVTYFNPETGYVGCWEIHEEKKTLCVRPEVWKQKMGIC